MRCDRFPVSTYLVEARVCVILFFCLPASLYPATGCPPDSHDTGSTEFRMLLNPVERKNCVYGPLLMEVTFENVTKKDILLVDPRTCEGCLFFDIRDPHGNEVPGESQGDVIYQIMDANVRGVLFRPGGKVSTTSDVTRQYFGLYKHHLKEPGIYRVTGKFILYARFMFRGKESYRKRIVSAERQVLVQQCFKE